MLINNNNKHTIPFFSSTYSSFLEKKIKNESLSFKGSLKSKVAFTLKNKTTIVLLHTYNKNINKINLSSSNKKENLLFNKKESQSLGPMDKKGFFFEDKGVLAIKNKQPYSTIQNQKGNKPLLDLHLFLKKTFFPMSSRLGVLAIRKHKTVNSSIPVPMGGGDLPFLYPQVPKEEEYLPIYKKLLKGFIGKELNSHNQHLIHSKSITYSFKNNNNINSLLSSKKLIDIFLKKFFLSIGTLISKPTYLNRQDKIIIRLFVYFSPKLNNFLKTSLLNKSS